MLLQLAGFSVEVSFDTKQVVVKVEFASNKKSIEIKLAAIGMTSF